MEPLALLLITLGLVCMARLRLLRIVSPPHCKAAQELTHWVVLGAPQAGEVGATLFVLWARPVEPERVCSAGLARKRCEPPLAPHPAQHQCSPL